MPVTLIRRHKGGVIPTRLPGGMPVVPRSPVADGWVIACTAHESVGLGSSYEFHLHRVATFAPCTAYVG